YEGNSRSREISFSVSDATPPALLSVSFDKTARRHSPVFVSFNVADASAIKNASVAASRNYEASLEPAGAMNYSASATIYDTHETGVKLFSISACDEFGNCFSSPHNLTITECAGEPVAVISETDMLETPGETRTECMRVDGEGLQDGAAVPGWNLLLDSNSYRTSATAVTSSSNAAAVRSGSGAVRINGDYYLGKQLDKACKGIVTVDYWHFPRPGSSTNSAMALFGAGKEQFLTVWKNDQNRWYVGAAGSAHVADYSGEYTHIIITIDTRTALFNVSIDGQQVDTNRSVENAAALSNGIDYISMHSGRGGAGTDSYVDDIVIKGDSKEEKFCASRWQKSKSGTPPLEYLKGMKAVLWSEGDEFGISDSDAVVLIDYAAGGGRLLLEGSEIASRHVNDDFMLNVTHSKLFEDIIFTQSADGKTPSTKINITRRHPGVKGVPASFDYDKNVSFYPDSLEPTDGAALASWESGAAIVVYHNASRNEKTAFLPFSFDALGADIRNNLTSSMLGWLIEDGSQDFYIKNITMQPHIVAGKPAEINLSLGIFAPVKFRLYVDGAESFEGLISKNDTTLARNFSAGTHKVEFILNPDFEKTESDYLNNNATAVINAVPNIPEILVHDMSFLPTNPKKGDDVSIIAHIKNNGGSRIDTSIEFGSNGTVIMSEPVSLAEGEAMELAAAWKAAEGVTNITVEADPGNSIAEHDETNNAMSAEIYACTKPSGIALVSNDNASSYVTEKPDSSAVWTEALRKGGYCFDTFRKSSGIGDVKNYKLLIWSAGDFWNSALDASDALLVANFSGKKVFEGADIAFDAGQGAKALLGSELQRDLTADENTTIIISSHRIFSGISGLTFDYKLSPYPDSMNGSGIASWNSGGAAITANSSTVHVGFSIDSVTEGETLAANILKFMLSSAPELKPVGSKAVTEGETLAFKLDATDADNDSLTFSASGMPQGASLNAAGFSWTPKAGQAGTYNVTFYATDGTDTDSETIAIEVKKKDPCEGVTCNSPPAGYCDGSARMYYNSSGTCSGGTCSYSTGSEQCIAPAPGCSGSSRCTYNATCAGGTCGSTQSCSPCPTPGADCYDSDTRRTYSPTCSSGTCGSTPTDTDCTAPAPTCAGTSRRTYTASCSDGNCGAISSDTSCPTSGCSGSWRQTGGCSDGACYLNNAENCADRNGWVDTSGCYADCDNGWARTSKNQEYRDYGCSSGSCSYSVTATRKVACSTGAYCADSNGWHGGGENGCGTPDDPTSYYRTYGCSSGACTYSSTDSKDCDSSDGWHGGGNSGGCGADPSSEDRDYYVTANSNSCTYSGCNSQNCDSQDVCGNVCEGSVIRQYLDSYVVANTGSCSSYYGPVVEDCSTKASTDSDGDNPQSQGTAADYTGCSGGSCTTGSLTDSCASSTTVTEYLASGSSYTSYVKNCEEYEGEYYCSGNSRVRRDWGCASGACSDAAASDTVVQVCADGCSNGQCNGDPCSGVACSGDGWYDAGSQYAACNAGQACAAQNQDYRDYGCSSGSCTYSVTDARTVYSNCSTCPPASCSGATRYYNGGCSNGQCTFNNNQDCSEDNGWYDKGSSYACCDGLSKATCQDQEYRDYYCSSGSCASYTVTNTRTQTSGPAACDSPPASYCSGTTRVYYSSSGSCSSGACIYASSNTTCLHGCSAGTCNNDPCAGVTCNAPPAATCVDSRTLRAYNSPGSCSGGSCSYSSTDTACTYSCSGGACNSNPCSPNPCTSPPGSSCSGNDRVTYGSTGACTPSGANYSCAYPESRQACKSGCSGGMCNADQCTAGARTAEDFPDIFTYGAAGNWTVRFGDGSGDLAPQASGTWSPGWTVMPAKFNYDSYTDLLLYSAKTGAWFKTNSDGKGGFSYESGKWLPDWTVTIMNLNGDGLHDAFLYNPESGAWLRCLSGSGFSCGAQGTWSAGWNIYPARFNYDSLDDLLVYNAGSGAWFRVTNDDSAFTEAADYAGGTWSPGWSIYPGDFNG
ncbi:MAG: hypothetical protein HY519_01615, partial [Candidatus Aenigmarchaeota archaeon]|nr:hypothetical protein [Candidatus Aenigmarchaeota archaeon]